MAGMNSTIEAVSLMSQTLQTLEDTFYQIPGSAVLVRYFKASHQDDPGRTILEILLFLFVVRTWLQSRTRTESAGKHFVQFSEKEIDDLVAEWAPEPLCDPLTEFEEQELASLPVIAGPQGPKPKLANTGKTAINLASFNFTGLAGNDVCRERAIETLRTYGVGSCGPAGFYGTLDVHLTLERDIADFLGTEASILYSQGFATISSVIPAFCKRGDIIVADRGVNFAIQQGINISRSTVRWFDHNDLQSLEDVLQQVDKERRKKKWPLTRQFIITEGIFEKDGQMVDLPKIIELKQKYKYRLILDEGFSFGTVGRTGRGLTELYNVPASQVDMIIGSVATALAAGGGFCAGSQVVVDHQRINGTAFVFSASMPGLLATSASEGIHILRSTPSLLTTLHENVRAVRAVLDKVECVEIPSHTASPIIHLHVRPQSSSGGFLSSASAERPQKASITQIAPPGPPPFDIDAEERALQEIVDECMAQGVLITRAKRLRGQEMVETRPSIRLALSAALSRKECEKAAGVVKAACVRVLSKRK